MIIWTEYEEKFFSAALNLCPVEHFPPNVNLLGT